MHPGFIFNIDHTGGVDHRTAYGVYLSQSQVGISDDPPTALGTSTGRIAMFEQLLYESQPDEEDFAAELTRYIYSNNLLSASLELKVGQ